MRNISVSGRKDWQLHVRDWLDYQISHAKRHSNLDFDYEDIDYIFGVVDAVSPTSLWGGRIAGSLNITRLDEYWMYDHGIGIKLPLSTKSFDDAMYKNSIYIGGMYLRTELCTKDSILVGYFLY